MNARSVIVVAPAGWLPYPVLPVPPEAAVTVMAAVPFFPELVAVMVTEPAPLAVTSPDEETVATLLLELPHVGVVPDTVLPLEFLSVADSCAVAPTARLDDDGETATEATVDDDPVTEIDAVAVLPPALTVIVAAPAATPVTRPVEETEAIPLLELDHA